MTHKHVCKIPMADFMSEEDTKCHSVTFPTALALLIRLDFCAASPPPSLQSIQSAGFSRHGEGETDVSPFDVIDSARLLRQRARGEGERKDQGLKVLHVQNLFSLTDE